jgi:hypothetical protein
LFSAKV